MDINVEKDTLFALLYERIKGQEITAYTVLDIALKNMQDYEIEEFTRDIVNCNNMIQEVE